MSNHANKLYYGDNLDIMLNKMKLEEVDLIYLDPPFNSKKDYNLLYRTRYKLPVPEQAEAFTDTWDLDAENLHVAKTMPVLMKENGIDDEYIAFWRFWVNALKETRPDLLAYLTYMVRRLVLMRTKLSYRGSIYLHCDPNASHYLKIMMDGIFGHKNFQNEIVWKRTGAHGRAKRWGPIHDTILFYSKSDQFTWNRTYERYDDSYIETFYRFSDQHGKYRLVTLDGPGARTGSSGEPWRGVDPTPKGRHWEVPPDRALPLWFVHPDGYAAMSVQERLDVLDKAGLIYWPPKGSVPQYKRYLDVSEGNPLQDIITDIGPLSSHSNERLGYQTQKPVALLKRIIEASSNPGDTVFDPFCGCGTAIRAAEETGRNWIGCDIAVLSIGLIHDILKDRYSKLEGVHYLLDGIPKSRDAAELLFQSSPFQFQHWMVEKVFGFPSSKIAGDHGVDGRLYFEAPDGHLLSVVLSVKGGNIGPKDIRELRGAMDQDPDAKMGALLTLREPTRAMRQDAEFAGMYEFGGRTYKRIQIVTVQDLLDGKQLDTPVRVTAASSSAQEPLPFVYDRK